MELGTKLRLRDEDRKQIVREVRDSLKRKEVHGYKNKHMKNVDFRGNKLVGNVKINCEGRKNRQLAVYVHKQKIEELEVEHQSQIIAAEGSQKSSLESTHAIETHKPFKGPKLHVPLFNESRDNIDAYVQCFKRYAIVQYWNCLKHL